MGKSGVMLEGDPAAVAVKAKAAELKRELKKLLRVIVEEDDNDSSLDVNVMDRAKEALVALRELKVRRTASFRVDRGGSDGGCGGGGGGAPSSCPEEFRCPLSNQLMKDPVIVATGQTYDRPFIQKWLKSGNRTCPKTQQVLSHTLLIPNYLIKEMISQWCQSRGIKQPPQQQQQPPQHFLDDDDVTENERDRFYQLLNKMSSTAISEQKAAAKELRLLTKRMPAFRALFGESSDAIPKLIRPLCHTKRNGDIHHHEIQEDLVTTLLNLSIYDNNKKLVAETPMVIPMLIDALKCGTIETRSNAAAALFTLSALDSNKVLIGESSALGPLIDLLDEGHPLAMKDAASAIFNLCIIHENKARAVHEAAVSVVLKKIKDRVQVDELLAILAMLSTHQRAIEELGELRAVGCLLGIIRESCCARNKENCIAILYAMCVNDRTKLKEMREEESAHGTLSQLSRDGSSRAKRKASGILERINRAATLTHTA